MANRYLIQAIYGPKPSVPKASSNGDDAEPLDSRPVILERKDPNSTHDHTMPVSRSLPQEANMFARTGGSSPNTSRPLSLAERLYGSTVKLESEGTEYMNSERLDRNAGGKQEQRSQRAIASWTNIVSEWDDTEDDEDDSDHGTQPWAPTGSNLLAVGAPSSQRETNSAPQIPTQPRTRRNGGIVRNTLCLKSERYLPPPGPYYDQFVLPRLFDFRFTNKLCWVCWNPAALGHRPGSCKRMCRICGTADHPGQTCTALYCTLSWYKKRGAEPFARSADRQFRPSKKEFAILSEKGILEGIYHQRSTEHLGLVPNFTHTVTKDFYRNKELPFPTVPKEQPDQTPKQASTLGRDMLMRRETQAPASTNTGKSNNATLDPRLQGNYAYLTMSNAASPESSDSEGGIALPMTTPTAINTYNKNEDTTEIRLQELEDEVLKLKMENVQKDREIRRLKNENEDLRGTSHEPGQKRQRA